MCSGQCAWHASNATSCAPTLYGRLLATRVNAGRSRRSPGTARARHRAHRPRSRSGAAAAPARSAPAPRAARAGRSRRPSRRRRWRAGAASAGPGPGRSRAPCRRARAVVARDRREQVVVLQEVLAVPLARRRPGRVERRPQPGQRIAGSIAAWAWAAARRLARHRSRRRDGPTGRGAGPPSTRGGRPPTRGTPSVQPFALRAPVTSCPAGGS